MCEKLKNTYANTQGVRYKWNTPQSGCMPTLNSKHFLTLNHLGSESVQSFQGEWDRPEGGGGTSDKLTKRQCSNYNQILLTDSHMENLNTIISIFTFPSFSLEIIDNIL